MTTGYDRLRDLLRDSTRFEARFPGVCDQCGERVVIGDSMRWDEDSAIHADCTPPAEAETTEACARCYLAIAVNGTCGCEA